MRILTVPVALLVAAAIAPQQAPPQPAQQPSFRVSTDVVAVDVTVIDRDYRLVTGLGPDDFTVRVDGQPRRIVSVQFIDQSTGVQPVSTSAASSSASFLRVSSNQGSGGGRLVLLLIDQNSIPFGQLRVAANSVEQLLAAFGPADRVGLATLPGPRMVLEFGAERSRIVEAIKAIPGSAAQYPIDRSEMGYAEAFKLEARDRATLDRLIERECSGSRLGDPSTNKQETLDACVAGLQAQASRMVAEARQESARFAGALDGLLRALASIDAPKLIVLFSTGLMAPDALHDLSFVSRSSAAARTAIYAVRLDRALFDMTGRLPQTVHFEDRDAARTGLDAVVGRARGSVVEVTGSPQVPFARLAREMSGYYLIGIETTSGDRDGKTHRIAVDTSRRGVTVRARPEFAFTPATPPKANPTATDELGVVAKMLASPMPAMELPIRLTTFNLPDDDPAKVRVMIVADVDRDQPNGASVAVGYAAVDAQGKTAAGFARRVPLDKAASGALAFVSVVSLRPGSYTLKLGAIHGGQAGSVEHRFTARLRTSGAYQLGDLIVSDPIPAQAKIMAPPLDGRVHGDLIWAFAQLGVNGKADADGRLALEIARREDAPALLRAPLVVDATGKRLRAAQSAVNGRLLPPGDYIARVCVTGAGELPSLASTAFTLERGRSPLEKGPVPVAGVARFNPKDVLEPAVLGPFLEDLSATSKANRGAIDNAKAGRFQAAVQELKPGGAGDAVAPFIRGLALFSSGQLQPASDAFRQTIAAAPDFMVGAFYIGACYAAGGKEQQAIGAWQTSLVSLDRYPIVYRLLADALLRTGNVSDASDVLTEAQAKWPDDEALGMRLAQTAAESGRYEQAAPVLDRLIARQPGNADLLFLAMRAAFEAGVDAQPRSLDGPLAALRRYREMYVAAKGPREALVAEWVSYLESRAK